MSAARVLLPVKSARPIIGAVAYAGLGAVLCATVFLAPRYVPSGGYPYLAGAAVCASTAAAAALVFGPPQWALTAFVAYMTACHMHNSPFIIPFASVEWHPRELILFVLLGKFAVRILSTRAAIPLSPVHFFIGAFALAWASMAVTGLLAGNNLSNWIEEARYPLFLAAYIALLDLVATREMLFRMVWLIFGIALIAALASIALFLYMWATGQVIDNVQNYLGEYVRRQVGPFLLQSARPNAHQYFEVGSTILVALFFARDITQRARLGILIVLAVFAAAIGITMMRTAYVTTALGLGLLAFASLPRAARGPVLLGVLSLILFGGLAFGALVYGDVQQALPELGVSLQGRLAEIGGGLDVFQHAPLFGGGLGKTFEAMGYVAKQSQESYGQSTYLMVHNVWLYYLFKGGLVSFLLALFGLGGIAYYGYGLADRLPISTDRAFTRGLACAFLAQCIGSLAMPRFNYPTGFVFIALVATGFVILGHSAKGKSSSNHSA